MTYKRFFKIFHKKFFLHRFQATPEFAMIEPNHSTTAQRSKGKTDQRTRNHMVVDFSISFLVQKTPLQNVLKIYHIYITYIHIYIW